MTKTKLLITVGLPALVGLALALMMGSVLASNGLPEGVTVFEVDGHRCIDAGEWGQCWCVGECGNQDCGSTSSTFDSPLIPQTAMPMPIGPSPTPTEPKKTYVPEDNPSPTPTWPGDPTPTSTKRPTPPADPTWTPQSPTYTPPPPPTHTPVPEPTNKPHCDQGVGNGPDDCSPGNSDHNQPPNDEGQPDCGGPGNPCRGGKKK